MTTTALADVQQKFSIFHPVITFEHREFYERIISELSGIFPICNQGKCTAVEISENATEQEQITDLMKKVEDFSGQLLEVTKKLFDQFYQAKEDFSQSIYSNTAYIKINLIDRNLLERTCDVRWWALETAFGACIAHCDAVDRLIAPLLERIASFAATVTEELKPAVQGLLALRESGVGPLANAETRATVREQLGRLAGPGLGLTRGIDELLTSIDALDQKITYACDRLEDINNSYTLYRDLVITNKAGYVIANANRDQRHTLLGRCVAGESWFERALATKDGQEYVAQDICASRVEELPALIYSTAVREHSDTNGAVIGAMGVFFDFQGEAQLILEDYMPKLDDGTIDEGWYSYLTNEQGAIIASSDETVLPVGSIAHLPRAHRTLSHGQRINSYSVVEGQESAVFSAKTDGYLEYEGLGWSSHLVVPKSDIFSNELPSVQGEQLSEQELMHSAIIPSVNTETYIKVQDDKESIQLISLNGIVFASKLGKRGVSLGPIFDQITKTGDFATSMMEKLLGEMAIGELEMNLKALENSSKQAIDLIDRNLFERSADIRWWATDEFFWKALMEPSDEAFDAASKRLKVINSSYTMYRNLVLADSSGDIVACSKLEQRNELRKLNVSDQEWFQLGMRTAASTEYAVQDVCDSPLERVQPTSLVYVGGVRSNGQRAGESIGVLGICFDWDTEAGTILKTCLPKGRDGSSIPGAAAIYTNKDGAVIESTDADAFPVGATPPLPAAHMALGKGESIAGIMEMGGRRYCIGSARTQGYREYQGLAWCAHIIRPLDA